MPYYLTSSGLVIDNSSSGTLVAYSTRDYSISLTYSSNITGPSISVGDVGTAGSYDSGYSAAVTLKLPASGRYAVFISSARSTSNGSNRPSSSSRTVTYGGPTEVMAGGSTVSYVSVSGADSATVAAAAAMRYYRVS